MRKLREFLASLIAPPKRRYIEIPARPVEAPAPPKAVPAPPKDFAEGGEGPDGPPIHEVGDVVITFNPYNYEYVNVDYDETPLYYEIKAIMYDPNDATYRYYLDGEDDWYAEDWLDDAPYPFMAKALTEVQTGSQGAIEAQMALIAGESNEGEADKVTKLTEKEQAQLGEELDKQAKAYVVDRLLDVMNTGTAAEKAEAKAMLAEITKEQRYRDAQERMEAIVDPDKY